MHASPYAFIHSFIHSFISNIYIVPLQEKSIHVHMYVCMLQCIMYVLCICVMRMRLSMSVCIYVFLFLFFYFDCFMYAVWLGNGIPSMHRHLTHHWLWLGRTLLYPGALESNAWILNHFRSLLKSTIMQRDYNLQVIVWKGWSQVITAVK